MVNSFLVYKQYCEDNGIKVMSHYGFQKSIRHVWMEPNYYKKKLQKAEDGTTDGGGSLRSMSTVSTGAIRWLRVCDSLLNPYSGALKCCVNRNILHFPTKCRSAKDYCQLHYWCTTKRITFSCAFYYNCNVVLCMDCYETFHSVGDLHEKKTELKEKMSKT